MTLPASSAGLSSRVIPMKAQAEVMGTASVFPVHPHNPITLLPPKQHSSLAPSSCSLLTEVDAACLSFPTFKMLFIESQSISSWKGPLRIVTAFPGGFGTQVCWGRGVESQKLQGARVERKVIATAFFCFVSFIFFFCFLFVFFFSLFTFFKHFLSWNDVTSRFPHLQNVLCMGCCAFISAHLQLSRTGAACVPAATCWAGGTSTMDSKKRHWVFNRNIGSC